MKFDNGKKFRWVEGDELEEIAKFWPCFKYGFFEIDKSYYPTTLFNTVDRTYNFKWRPSDLLLIGHPKTGTTWLQLVLWTMRNDPNLDHRSTDLLTYYKVIFLEYEGFFDFKASQVEKSDLVPALRKYCPTLKKGDFRYIDMWDHVPGLRVMKSHFALDITGPKVLDTSKVIYLMRDPRDALVSYYYFSRALSVVQYQGNLEDFIDHYMEGKIIFGSIFEHFKTMWEYRNHPNFYILYYENFTKNTLEELKKLDKFIGTNLTEQQFENVMHKTSFKTMKEKDPFTFGENTFIQENLFYRKGQVGDAKEKISPAASVKLNKFCREFFAGYDLPYDFSDK